MGTNGMRMSDIPDMKMRKNVKVKKTIMHTPNLNWPPGTRIHHMLYSYISFLKLFQLN